MAYYTFSQGFRPGGFNRTKTLPNGTVVLTGGSAVHGRVVSDQYQKPAGYSSDNLTNNEIGAKTEFLDHRLQLNLSAYYMKWSNVQLPLFDPGNSGQHDLRRQRTNLRSQRAWNCSSSPASPRAYGPGIEFVEQLATRPMHRA